MSASGGCRAGREFIIWTLNATSNVLEFGFRELGAARRAAAVFFTRPCSRSATPHRRQFFRMCKPESWKVAQPDFPAVRLCCLCGLFQQRLCLRLQFKPRVLMHLSAGMSIIPCAKSKMLSGGRPSSCKTVSMILPVWALLESRLRRKVSRPSWVRATMRSRAALIPTTNGAREEWRSSSMRARHRGRNAVGRTPLQTLSRSSSSQAFLMRS